MGGVVTAPVLIAFGIFRQVKAAQVQKEITDKIQQLKKHETKIGRDRAKLQAVRQRRYEVQRTVQKLTEQIKIALHNANPNIVEDVYRIVQIAKTLRATIDQPVVPASQQ